MRRFTARDKMNVLTLLHSGMSKRALASLLGIEKREIFIWDLRFQQYGMAGLEPLRKRSFSDDFKREVVREYIAGGTSTRQLCAKYGISLSTLKNWVRAGRKNQAES